MSSITAKKRKFALKYVEHGNRTRAAKEAGYSPKSAASQGSRLLKDANVRALIDEIRKKHAKESGITVAKVSKMHQEAFKMAKDKENPAVMTKAARNLSDLYGLGGSQEDSGHDIADALLAVADKLPV